MSAPQIRCVVIELLNSNQAAGAPDMPTINRARNLSPLSTQTMQPVTRPAALG